MLREIFLGKPIHWILWVVITGLLSFFGSRHMHVRNFNGFIIALLLIGVVSVLFIFFTYRKGEAITRDPFEE